MFDKQITQSGKKESGTSRRSALQTIGACGVGLAGIGVFGGSVQATEIDSISIEDDIPTEPEDDVYDYVDEEVSWPGDYEISHTMEWFRSTYTNDDTWLHDFSIQGKACSRHQEYGSLIPECTGWGYRIEGPDGNVAPLTSEEYHGVYPQGDSGDAPEWVDVVMEGAVGAMSTPASILYTADELQELMEPADGFDFDVDDGFRWLLTHSYTDDGDEDVSMHHRVFYESSSYSPEIETNATVRIHHDPIGSDEWLDMEVTTNGQTVIDPADSDQEDPPEDIHPEDMDAETIEKLGIKEVKDSRAISESSSDDDHVSTLEDVLDEGVEPEYVMTNCPWESECEVSVVEEDR